MAKGLTQQQLGEAAGVHYKFVGEVERGERCPSTAVNGLSLNVSPFSMPCCQPTTMYHRPSCHTNGDLMYLLRRTAKRTGSQNTPRTDS